MYLWMYFGDVRSQRLYPCGFQPDVNDPLPPITYSNTFQYRPLPVKYRVKRLFPVNGGWAFITLG
jgi:hypothetical protein